MTKLNLTDMPSNRPFRMISQYNLWLRTDETGHLYWEEGCDMTPVFFGGEGEGGTTLISLKIVDWT